MYLHLEYRANFWCCESQFAPNIGPGQICYQLNWCVNALYKETLRAKFWCCESWFTPNVCSPQVSAGFTTLYIGASMHQYLELQGQLLELENMDYPKFSFCRGVDQCLQAPFWFTKKQIFGLLMKQNGYFSFRSRECKNTALLIHTALWPLKQFSKALG